MPVSGITILHPYSPPTPLAAPRPTKISFQLPKHLVLAFLGRLHQTARPNRLAPSVFYRPPVHCGPQPVLPMDDTAEPVGWGGWPNSDSIGHRGQMPISGKVHNVDSGLPRPKRVPVTVDIADIVPPKPEQGEEQVNPDRELRIEAFDPETHALWKSYQPEPEIIDSGRRDGPEIVDFEIGRRKV